MSTRNAPAPEPRPSEEASAVGRSGPLAGGDDAERRFEEEALPNLDAVYRFALRLVGDEAAAEDLVQETFLRAYRSWHQYTPGTNCKSWLFTICRNIHLRNAERQKKHEEIVSQEATGEARGLSRENPVFMSTRSEDPEGTFFASIVDDEVLRAIEALPEEFRTPVVLADREDLSYKEISELLEVPVGTVKSRLFRGRRMLQRHLHDYAVDVGYLPDQRPRKEGPESPHSHSDGEGSDR